jgi:hypothetical protein
MVIVLVGTVVGALLIALVDVRQFAPRQLEIALYLLIGLLVLPAFATVVYFWTLGEKIISAREHPPPGMLVIRDTRVVTGDRAVAFGRLIKVLAAGFGVLAVAAGAVLWRLASMLG